MSHGDPVLVVGATGFVGGATVRALRLAGHDVTEGVRRAGEGATVYVDILDSPSISAACRGKATIVHCAVGPPGDTRIIVEGTRNLIAAAHGAGVKHLIYLSSVAVYTTENGLIDEQSSTDRPQGSYGRAKLAAEAMCRDAAGEGIAVTILRPSLIYGPGSPQWTELFVRRMRSGRWHSLGPDGDGTCNLIHIDDLARFIVNRVEAAAEQLAIFNVNGTDLPSWNHYLERLNAALALPPLAPRRRGWRRGRWLMRPALRATAQIMQRVGLHHAAGRLEARSLAIPSRDEIARFSAKMRYDISELSRVGFLPSRRVDDAIAEIARLV